MGVAVLCEDKNLFIQNIFSLDDASQSILKDMVEHVMRKTYDLEVAEDEADVGTTDVGVEGHQDIGQLTSELNRYCVYVLVVFLSSYLCWFDIVDFIL